jgi:hypothetical protein
MAKETIKKSIFYFKLLIILNICVSIFLTYTIILYNIEYFNYFTIFITIYASTWFFSLYKIYNFSKNGLNIYISMVILGFILGIFSDLKIFGKLYYILSLLEHLIIGSIITFSYFSKLKIKFK